MLISFKQNTFAKKVVPMYISKLSKEMIDILRQLYFPRIETTSRYRKISGGHTKGYACLMCENFLYRPVVSVLGLFFICLNLSIISVFSLEMYS